MVTRTNGNLVDGTDHSISTRNDPSLLNDSESLESMLPSKVLCTSDAAERATKELLLSNLENFIAVGVLEPFTGSQDFSKSMKSPDYPLTEVDLLEQAAWIRTIPLENNGDPERSAVRVYVLPEDIGRAVVPRSSVPLHRALKVVMSKLNVSSGAWDGHVTPFSKPLLQPSEEDESLFYIFNTLESPAPNPNSVCDPWARTVMEDVLAGSTNSDENFSLVGLKTLLYPYQRRSAALMIQKEYAPGEFLDPRLREFRGPTGHIYYYDKEEGIVTRHPRLYSGVRGGVLAETMGYGKTLICLALILATKGHFPQIPSAYFQDSCPVREKTASLLEMAAAAAGRLSLPWKSHFDRLSTTGIHYQRCLSACERNRGSYAITQAPKYYCRNTTSSKIKSCHLQLSSGTLLIVPSNLVDHWLREIAKHTQTLRVLVLREKSNSTPPAHELLDYDIILFSKSRFECEHGGFSACSSELYDSPLKEIHWLRIIVDEGHNFASAGGKSNAIHLLERLHVERRWVVSGTPSDGLYGVEICLASQETNADAAAETSDRTVAILKARKDPRKSIAEELKNLDKLRRIVVDFLCLKPWANCQGNDSANWAKYMKSAGADGKRKMARSLRPTLQSIVVRHRTEDINKDLSLPKLHNKVVYLEPTYYDKLSLNMFIFQLTVNAITSERTDQDYMFHPRNRKYLSVTINHLRQAGFWWCGSEKADVEATLNIARNYMEKNRQNMTDADLSLLWEGILIAENTISCSAWNAFSRYHEVGVLIHGFPEHAREVWSIDGQCEKQGPLLLGLSQAREAQKFVTARLCAADPAEGIAGAGIKVKGDMERGRKGNVEIKSTPNSPIPSQSKTNDYLVHSPKPETPLKKRKFSNCKSLLAKSPLAKVKLVATASAKLTYLLDRVLELQGTEKIIIFYENTNTAFWVAEGLEVLGVDFRIYASTLKATVKSEYLSVFNNSDAVRVLLMDLRQASHGLHVASASRIFIIVPIWDPNVESQAIKRAHRISQTKPVYVETLVLQGTLEDKMLRRRKQMSSAEMQHAEKDLLEDHVMSHIIQTEGFIPILNDTRDTGCAYLKSMPGFFDRHKLPVPDAHDIKAPAPSPTLLPTKLSAARLSSSQQTPFKKEGKAAHSDIPFLNSDISPGLEITTKRRQPFLDEVITPDGLIMTIDKRSTPRKRRAVPRLQDIADGNNDSSGGSVPRTPGLKDRKNVPEDPFYIPGDDCTAGAPFCLSIPDD